MFRGGWIELIVGCVFSGKTDEGDVRIVKETYSKIRRVIIFTPDRGRRTVKICHNGENVDTKDKMVSRSGKTRPAIEIPWDHPEVVFNYMTDDITTVVFEEAQFFSRALVAVCRTLAGKYQKRVIIIGLDKDCCNHGFGPIPELMVDAEIVDKELATCVKCGSMNANCSWLPPEYWKDLQDGNLLPGDAFEPVCRACFDELVEQFGLPLE